MPTEMDQVSSEKGDTWPKILKYNYEKYGRNRKAMRYKRYGIWQPYTWKDYYLNVKYLALGLFSLGFEPGDKLLIIGDNAPQWYYAELAAQANHGVSVGVYSDLNPPEIKYIAENSEAKFAIVQDQEQVDKFLQIRDELPLVKKVIYWSYKGLAHYADPILMEYGQVLQLGEKYEESHPRRFEQEVETGKADDICALVYTSGTTGIPKGAVHTYKTMRAGTDYLLRLDPWYENDNVVPYLPPAWMTEQWFGIGCHLLSGCVLNFTETPETQQRDTRETEPSILFYGSRIWESQAATLQAQILGADPVQRLSFHLFMPIAYKATDLRFQKKRLSLFLKIVYFLGDIVLFRPVRKRLGLSNARICYTTGAMLSSDAFRLYHALGLPLKNLYSTTEGGAFTGARGDDIRLETADPAQRGIEVRIAESGEFLYRQPAVFVGYYKNPEKTAAVLKDGWFCSGDRCFIKGDGLISFVDRMEDMVELASGNKLAPQSIESRLRFSPYIKDAWVFGGPKREYASAIIIINYVHVSRWAGQRRVAYNTFAELSQRPEVYQLVEQEIDRINRTLPPGSRIRKYVNLHKEFDPDEGELTRTRKLRKAFLEERYRELIDAIYSDQAEALMEARIQHQDGRTETAKKGLSIKSLKGDSL